MKITLTFEEIMERGRWNAFCALRGLNPAKDEGAKDEVATLTYEEAKKLGLLVLGNVKSIEM